MIEKATEDTECTEIKKDNSSEFSVLSAAKYVVEKFTIENCQLTIVQVGGNFRA